jgi:hypothetical protein
MNRTLICLVFCLFTFGCGSDPAPPPAAEPSAAPAVAEEPESLGDAPVEFGAVLDLARAIRSDPAATETLLADAGYTIDRFEAELAAIARDPARSAAWVAQLR